MFFFGLFVFIPVWRGQGYSLQIAQNETGLKYEDRQNGIVWVPDYDAISYFL